MKTKEIKNKRNPLFEELLAFTIDTEDYQTIKELYIYVKQKHILTQDITLGYHKIENLSNIFDQDNINKYYINDCFDI